MLLRITIFEQYFCREAYSSKKFSKKKFWWKFFQGYYLGENDFATIKKFRPKIISEINGKLCLVLWIWITISKEKHITVKKLKKKKIWWKFFQGYYLGGNDIATIKKFLPKIISEIHGK